MKGSTLRALCDAFEAAGPVEALRLGPNDPVKIEIELPLREWQSFVRLRDNVAKYTPLTGNA